MPLARSLLHIGRVLNRLWVPSAVYAVLCTVQLLRWSSAQPLVLDAAHVLRLQLLERSALRLASWGGKLAGYPCGTWRRRFLGADVEQDCSLTSSCSPSVQHLYNGTFGRMDVLDILNDDLSLNEERYAEVGPLQLTPYFALSYGVSFALLTSALSTVLLWHIGDIRKAIASSFKQTGDVHVERKEVTFSRLAVPGA